MVAVSLFTRSVYPNDTPRTFYSWAILFTKACLHLDERMIPCARPRSLYTLCSFAAQRSTRVHNAKKIARGDLSHNLPAPQQFCTTYHQSPTTALYPYNEPSPTTPNPQHPSAHAITAPNGPTVDQQPSRSSDYHCHFLPGGFPRDLANEPKDIPFASLNSPPGDQQRGGEPSG